MFHSIVSEEHTSWRKKSCARAEDNTSRSHPRKRPLFPDTILPVSCLFQRILYFTPLVFTRQETLVSLNFTLLGMSEIRFSARLEIPKWSRFLTMSVHHSNRSKCRLSFSKFTPKLSLLIDFQKNLRERDLVLTLCVHLPWGDVGGFTLSKTYPWHVSIPPPRPLFHLFENVISPTMPLVLLICGSKKKIAFFFVLQPQISQGRVFERCTWFFLSSSCCYWRIFVVPHPFWQLNPLD